MNSNYFYSNIVQTSKNKSFLEEMQSIAESIKQQVYVLSGPLIDGKYQYNDDSLIILLSSKKKIAFVTTSKMNDNFNDLCEDIIEDIGSVSDKYGYKEKIGRPRKWRDRLTGIYSLKEIDDVRAWFCNDIVINDTADFRTLDLLISLFIGSINDVKNINGKLCVETFLTEETLQNGEGSQKLLLKFSTFVKNWNADQAINEFINEK